MEEEKKSFNGTTTDDDAQTEQVVVEEEKSSAAAADDEVHRQPEEGEPDVPRYEVLGDELEVNTVQHTQTFQETQPNERRGRERGAVQNHKKNKHKERKKREVIIHLDEQHIFFF